MSPPENDILSQTIAVVLAAGLGKRMQAAAPKVVFELEGKPLIQWVVDAAYQAGIKRAIVVIGHLGEMVQAALHDRPVEYVRQHELLGTGHAVMQVEPLIRGFSGNVLILLGDVPRIRPSTLRDLLLRHCSSRSSATVMTVKLEAPTGYGRVVRLANGEVDRIVEERDADDNIKRINEINTGTMCFSAPDLLSVLHEITNANTQREYYITDAIRLLRERGRVVSALLAQDAIEGSGINSPEQLAALQNWPRGARTKREARE